MRSLRGVAQMHLRWDPFLGRRAHHPCLASRAPSQSTHVLQMLTQKSPLLAFFFFPQTYSANIASLTISPIFALLPEPIGTQRHTQHALSVDKHVHCCRVYVDNFSPR